jgi:hypothetical protein
MIEILISLLVLILVLAVIYWIASLVVGAFGLPPVTLQIVGAILGLILLVWLLGLVGYAAPVWRWPARP